MWEHAFAWNMSSLSHIAKLHYPGGWSRFQLNTFLNFIFRRHKPNSSATIWLYSWCFHSKLFEKWFATLILFLLPKIQQKFGTWLQKYQQTSTKSSLGKHLTHGFLYPRSPPAVIFSWGGGDKHGHWEPSHCPDALAVGIQWLI